MPTYDYECSACGHEFEVFQGIRDDLLVKCPECGKKKLKRLFGTGAGIIFKGSGFYQTDYRSDSYKQKAAADKPSSDTAGGAAKSDSASSSKSEGKSESKSDSKGDSNSGSSDGAGTKSK